MEVELKLPGIRKHWKRISAAIIIVLIIVALILWLPGSSNPLPSEVRKQLNFALIYPSTTSVVDKNTYSYNASQKTLTYNVSYSGHIILMSEQAAPGDSSNVTEVYYEGLGLRPVAQMQTKLGLAEVVNFYSSNDYSALGNDAVLATKGTLLIARPDGKLSLEQWKAFLNSLSVSR